MENGTRRTGKVGMSEFIMKASTDEQAEFCRRYSNMQELVRCKDCTLRNEINCPQYYRRTEISDDYFCADGKRKEGR